MTLWIPIAIAAASFQTVRFMLRKVWRSGTLSTAGATFSRFLFALPLVVLLVAGYVAVWMGFSIFAAALQMILFNADLISAFGDSRSGVLSAVLLAAAGLYQFSPIKEACLSKCRQPMTFFMQHFDEGPWRNGVRLGLVCLGCCWALMLLGFVGGVMNLAWMGIATVFMVVEKLPQIGHYITKPMGFALILGACVVAGWPTITNFS